MLGATLTIHPQEIYAQAFTGADFSTWETSAQDSYIQTSLTMAGVVFSQVDPEKSACIDNWYLGEAQKADRNTYIRNTIAEYGSYHPSGTILAILLEACGPLN
ncbi:hypothetical protein [Cognatiyoonia sp. IB215182]|uniref:hypothetical protein n=1 Tax=Cognatiyoonia sp. IB215182 TaxID=3097353 RepID=UPI002A240C31|nr:hypothetical protein [Cognatiyoonia sp. IB215182]